MPDTKISALTAATDVYGDEQLVFARGGSTYKGSLDLLMAFFASPGAPVEINASGGVTLTNAHYGRLLHVTAAGTITLPPAPVGTKLLRIRNLTSALVPVTGAVTGDNVSLQLQRDAVFYSHNGGWRRLQPQTEGAGGVVIPVVNNRWYPADEYEEFASSSLAPAPLGVAFQPFVLRNDRTIKGLSCRVATAGAAGALGAMAIYASAIRTVSGQQQIGATGAPLVWSDPAGVVGTGTFDATTTGDKGVTAVTPALLAAGVYFFALRCNDAAARFSIGKSSFGSYLIGASAPTIGFNFVAGHRSSNTQLTAFTDAWGDVTGWGMTAEGARFFGGYQVGV